MPAAASGETRATYTERTTLPAAHLYSHSHERPAARADVALPAACAYVVIVRQVDVKHQLALHRLECALGVQSYAP